MVRVSLQHQTVLRCQVNWHDQQVSNSSYLNMVRQLFFWAWKTEATVWKACRSIKTFENVRVFNNRSKSVHSLRIMRWKFGKYVVRHLLRRSCRWWVNGRWCENVHDQVQELVWIIKKEWFVSSKFHKIHCPSLRLTHNQQNSSFWY